MISTTNLVNTRYHQRIPRCQHLQRSPQRYQRQCATRCKNTGDISRKIKQLNEEDSLEGYYNDRSSFLKNHPDIDESIIDGLTADQLRRISVYFDYIHACYINLNKFGYLTRFDILSNNEKCNTKKTIEMTAAERIDARNKLMAISKEFPNLETHCYNMMLSLRVLGKDKYMDASI